MRVEGSDVRSHAEIIQSCRACGSARLERVLDLGRTPLADRLLTAAMLEQPEPLFPLSVFFCADCTLMQIAETVPAETLFCEDYPYYSSFSPALLEHSRLNAEELIARRGLGPDSLVVELASNDGYMLKNFRAAEIPVLGIDPADGPARAAQEAGIETLCTFFTHDLARRLRDEGRRADVIIANNVLAHVPDLNGFVAGMATLLKDDGVAVIECPYVRDLIDHCEFDTIYHEHLCYYSVTALSRLFARHGLSLNDVTRLAIHGGSVRLYVERHDRVGQSVRTLLAEEEALGVTSIAYYADFARRVEHVRATLVGLLRSLKEEGKRIAAYGAAAKGATLINYCEIGPELIDFVVDRNTHKQGRFMPGRHIPISPVSRLVEEMPEYVLLLAWNFADEIVRQQGEYLSRGGTFIKPVPEPRLITARDVPTSVGG
jgi:SAM-dependent methyltransferase